MAGVQVTAVSSTGGQNVSWTTTDDQGHYELTPPTGSYRFVFSSGRTIRQWYGGGEDQASGTVVPVTGPTTGISTELRPGGRFSGTLTGTVLGTPTVAGRRADGSLGAVVGSATVSADGQFEGWLVTEHPVHLGLTMTTPERLRLTRWSGDKYAAAHSPVVQVVSGASVGGLQVGVPSVATASGHVTNVHGAPLWSDLTRHVIEDGTLVPVGIGTVRSSRETGAYQALVPADAAVTIAATGYPGEGFQQTWLGGTTDAAQAATLTLAAGEANPSADIALIGGTTATGSVLDARRLPVAGVTVTVFRDRTDVVLGTAESDARGRYEVPGLGAVTAGSITVRFSGEHLVTGWSWNKPNQATAQLYSSTTLNIAPQTAAHETGYQLPDPAAPVMTGSGLTGTTLSAAPGAAGTTDTTEELRWYCGTRSLDVTGPTYAVTSADDGCALHVRQVSLRPGWASGMADSPSVTARPFAATGFPVVYGDKIVGHPLTVRGLTWSARPDAVERQWLRDGQPIIGATATTYTPRLSDIGTAISVRLTAHRDAEGLTATRTIRADRRVRAATALRIVSVVPKWRRAEIAVRITSPGVSIPAGYITVVRRYADGTDASVSRLRVTGSPQTVRFTYRSYDRVNRLIFLYPGSRDAGPARLATTVRVR